MASIKFRSDRNREGWVVSFLVDGKRKQIWFGLPEKDKGKVERIKSKIENLINARKCRLRPEPDDLRWAESQDERIYAHLASVGLIASRSTCYQGDEAKFLVPFLNKCIDDRKSDWSLRTVSGYSQVVDWVSKHQPFAKGKRLEAITKGDVERWVRFMRESKLAAATISKHAKRLRTMLQFAVDDRLLSENPAKGLKFGDETNAERKEYVSSEKVQRIINSCHDHDWRLILGLARFAGMRPGEIVRLKWTDLDWDSERIRIAKFKTKSRECPMFPPLKSMLLKASEAAPTGAIYVIQQYRESNGLCTRLDRIVEKAGFKPWEKTFPNLRASCRTDLEFQMRGNHACNLWLGHSKEVAEKHYLQVTEDAWKRAQSINWESGADFGATVSQVIEAFSSSDDGSDQSKVQVLSASDTQSECRKRPGRGSKGQRNSQGLSAVLELAQTSAQKSAPSASDIDHAYACALEARMTLLSGDWAPWQDEWVQEAMEAAEGLLKALEALGGACHAHG
jgi:integrase